MERFRIRIKQTLATLICDKKYIDIGIDELVRQRQSLETYLEEYPAFAHSFVPLESGPGAPELVKRMSEASFMTGVGPMASVAGAIAEYTVRAVVSAGAGHVIMDNGGDIAMKINRPVIVGLYPGQTAVKHIGFRISPREGIFGICTSSGIIGHSASRGVADSVTVVSRDVVLADAMATAIGNDVQNREQRHLERLLRKRLKEPVTGMVVVAGDSVAQAGEVPRMIRARFDINRINLG
jgi:ApbE superfamily uncharacterized protein (UPF0280 family)